MTRRIRTSTGLGTAAAAVALCLWSTAPALAQSTGSITGVVQEAASGRPLAGAQVYIPDTEFGTLTTANGRFLLNGVPAGEHDLRVTLIGYGSRTERVTVTADGTARVEFHMETSAIQLDQVVVSGAGAPTEKRKLGNTIASIDAAGLENAPVNSFSEILQGREAGVVGLPSSGLTGEGTRIRIRGTSSMSQSNEPIVYLDGVRIDNAGGFGRVVGAGGGGTPSRLDDINPESIERIEILKGAAAATLYGTEASNGVIQIFTKKGFSGAPRWTFQVEQGMVSYPDDAYHPNSGFVFDTDPSARLYGTDLGTTGVREFFGIDVEPYEVFSVPMVDNLFDTGYTQSYTGSVSGGLSSITYFLSGRYTSEDGPLSGDGRGPGGSDLGPANDVNNKKQASLNVNIFPMDRLRLRVGSMYTETHHETPNNNNNIYGTVSLAMFGKPELAWCDTDAGSMPAGDGTCTGPGNPTGQVAFMTVRESFQQVTAQDVQHYNGSMSANYELLENIDLEGTFGVDIVNQRSFEFAPFGYDVDAFTSNNTQGFRALDERNHSEVSFDAKATWESNLVEAITSQLVVGGQVYHTKTEASGGYGSDFPGPGLEVVEAASYQEVYESFLSVVNAGVFFQEQLGYNDFAFLTVGARYDANSAFGENFEGVLYPKASLSVIPSDMDLWTSSMLSTLRFRLAWGRSGQQPGAFDKLTTFGPLASAVGPGVSPQNLGNPDLKPEVSTEIEIGAELGLFNDRAAFDATYWTRSVTDALVSQQFPVTGGFRAEQLTNIGEMAANGFEVAANGLLLNTGSFSVDVFANAAYIAEEIRDMGGAPPLKVGGSYPRYRNFLMPPQDTDGDGEVDTYFAPGALFGAKLPDLGPDQLPYDTNGDGNADTVAELMAFVSSAGYDPALGFFNPGLELMLADEDGDGDPLDHYLGKPTPDWTGSFGARIGFLNNFEFSSLFEWKAGNFTIQNLTDGFRKSHPVIGLNTPKAAQAEATVSDPASTPEEKVEALRTWAYELKSLAPYSGLNLTEDGDFLRWREASLTYNVPAEFVQGIGFGLDDLSLTVTGRNLVLFTGYSGIDPELNALGRCGGGGLSCNFLDGVDAFGYPIPRRFSISVRAGF